MASESVAIRGAAEAGADIESRSAITQWCDDRQWAKLNGHLPVGVWRRLMKVNRALHVGGRIAEMLQADRFGRADKEDNPEIEFQGFDAVDREALELALIVALEAAEESLIEVRDNKFSCVKES